MQEIRRFQLFGILALFVAAPSMMVSVLADDPPGGASVLRPRSGPITEGLLHGKWTFTESNESWTWRTEVMVGVERPHQEPPEYGQCWVFSGIQSIVGRAVGIGSQSVTNFDSAHENQRREYQFRVDAYWTDAPSCSNSRRGRSDSVWNFHVWDEVHWLPRPSVTYMATQDWSLDEQADYELDKPLKPADQLDFVEPLDVGSVRFDLPSEERSAWSCRAGKSASPVWREDYRVHAKKCWKVGPTEYTQTEWSDGRPRFFMITRTFQMEKGYDFLASSD